jgi:17beta-estradiol 17-dehydrogenase / very-long-chain 3-oxoacyl-CoA reductase
MIDLQVLLTTHLTRALLPTRTHHKRHRPHWAPLLPVQSAYLHGFSRVLAIELELVREPPADIECLAVDVHNIAMNSNRRSVPAYWRAELVLWVLECVPLSWMDRILARKMMAMKVREVENGGWLDRRKDI